MSDYISREEAIKAIMGQPPDAHYPSWYTAQLKKVPAANVRVSSNKQTKPDPKKSDGNSYCPMSVFGGNRFAPVECIGTDCRWWSSYAQDCSVPLIADILADSSINQLIFRHEEEQDVTE